MIAEDGCAGVGRITRCTHDERCTRESTAGVDDAIRFSCEPTIERANSVCVSDAKRSIDFVALARAEDDGEANPSMPRAKARGARQARTVPRTVRVRALSPARSAPGLLLHFQDSLPRHPRPGTAWVIVAQSNASRRTVFGFANNERCRDRGRIAGRASEATPRSAGFTASARSAPQALTSSRLSERSARQRAK